MKLEINLQDGDLDTSSISDRTTVTITDGDRIIADNVKIGDCFTSRGKKHILLYIAKNEIVVAEVAYSKKLHISESSSISIAPMENKPEPPRKPVKTPPLDIHIGDRRVVRNSANIFRDKPRTPRVKTVTVGGELTKTLLIIIILISAAILALFLFGILR